MIGISVKFSKHTAVAMFCAQCIFLSAPLASKDLIKVGDVPPDYLGVNREGTEIYLSNINGKVVVITFWASWCGPCLKELPVLEKIQSKVGKDRFEAIAINYKEGKSQFKKIKKRLKSYRLTMTHDHKGKISELYRVKSVPHMFLINKVGKIAHIHVGYSEKALPGLAKEINALLRE